MILVSPYCLSMPKLINNIVFTAKDAHKFVGRYFYIRSWYIIFALPKMNIFSPAR